jgi:hypothetical protein
VGTTITHGSHSVLFFRGLRQLEAGTLATVTNASMQGVGTALGTVPGSMICVKVAAGACLDPLR